MNNNFLQVGRTIECGACFPDKYQGHGEQCGCICHSYEKAVEAAYNLGKEAERERILEGLPEEGHFMVSGTVHLFGRPSPITRDWVEGYNYNLEQIKHLIEE